ncbi:putative AAA+ superfamily ATPase [Rhizobium miluonense]|uniref:AAA+ superfamily ATPase n=1 Tax=Rhizobium miluonense TaxID=411945 RepID=A0ABU1SXV1_9HYPH|nr:putative AAA+ superfamily ATPase [Rhizobium miluonense]
MRMYKRFVERRADEALSDTPVVLIVGPRRAGKTTLVRKMEGGGPQLHHARRPDGP